MQLTAFTGSDGNVQGYSTGRRVAINPVSPTPCRTLFHELAHIILKHHDQDDVPLWELELEAEAVALLCAYETGLRGTTYSRAYLQGWGGGRTLGADSTRRVLHATTRILLAGGVLPKSQPA